MLTLLSPSKTQDYAVKLPAAVHNKATAPVLLKESETLIKELRKKSIDKIATLMDVSEKIATLNYNRYRNFAPPFTVENARQALLAFKGDVYTDIAVEEYTTEDFEFAQQHICILSGLYGVLKPLDLIQPYRLEMKTRLKNPRGHDLYKFWGDRITKHINQWLAQQDTKVLVNLASKEYSKALNQKKIKADMVTPVFKEYKEGSYKTIAIHAKRARGMMANFIVRNRIDTPELIKTFAEAGYQYSEPHSKGRDWVFVR